jgi:hypothetical protein
MAQLVQQGHQQAADQRVVIGDQNFHVKPRIVLVLGAGRMNA